MSKNTQHITTYANLTLPFYGYLGGAFYITHQPNMGFWDGFVWLWYVGRFVAHNFTMLSY